MIIGELRDRLKSFFKIYLKISDHRGTALCIYPCSFYYYRNA